MVTIDNLLRWVAMTIVAIPLAVVAVFVGSLILGLIAFFAAIAYGAMTTLF